MVNKTKRKDPRVTRIHPQVQLLIFIIRKSGKAYGPELVRFAKKELGIVAPSTVYQTMRMLEQSGVVKKTRLDAEDISLGYKHDKWVVSCSSLSDIARLNVLISELARGIEGLIFGRIIHTNWYIEQINRMVTVDSMELREFFGKLWVVAGSSPLYHAAVPLDASEAFNVKFRDFKKPVIELIDEVMKKPDIVFRMMLTEMPLYGILFFKLYYMLMCSGERYPDGSEITDDDRAFLENWAVQIKASMHDMEYDESDLSGSLICTGQYLSHRVTEYEGMGIPDMKDPRNQDLFASLLGRRIKERK